MSKSLRIDAQEPAGRDDTRRERDLVAIVAPCCNEAEALPLFYESLTSVLRLIDDLDFEVIFVESGSTDTTLQVLDELSRADPRVRVYSLSNNSGGHQIALTAGLDVAVADAVVQMDCDLQHPPDLLPRMIELWREGHDVVSAVRRDTADASLFKRFSSAAFYWFINRLSDTPIVAGAADFCLLSHRAHRALQSMPERHRFLRGMISWIGFRRAFVPFEAPLRAAGRSKYRLGRLVRFAIDAIFSFSPRPIRLVGLLGMMIVGLGLVYMGYILFHSVFLGDLIEGWASLIVTVLILGGLQLVGLGISGEYIARVYEESKGRPLYFFKQTPEDAETARARVRRAA